MIKHIKIKNVNAPIFVHHDGEEYAVEEYMYEDFCAFQKEIDEMIDKGATHLYIKGITTVGYIDDKIITSVDGTRMPIFIRRKFIKDE